MPRYYEFEISLQDLQPRIRRRMIVRAVFTFAQLHQAIQEAFGWENSHLWEFRLPLPAGRPIAGPKGRALDRYSPDARFVKLNEYFSGLRVVEWCEYVYDFGDDWVHEVKLVAAYAKKESFKRRLLDGERAAPPEDCGGLPGYERVVHFVETGKDVWDDDPEGLRTWLGDWRPDAFDLERAKAEFDR